MGARIHTHTRSVCRLFTAPPPRARGVFAKTRAPGNTCNRLMQTPAPSRFFIIYVHTYVPYPLFFQLPCDQGRNRLVDVDVCTHEIRFSIFVRTLGPKFDDLFFLLLLLLLLGFRQTLSLIYPTGGAGLRFSLQYRGRRCTGVVGQTTERVEKQLMSIILARRQPTVATQSAVRRPLFLHSCFRGSSQRAHRSAIAISREIPTEDLLILKTRLFT